MGNVEQRFRDSPCQRHTARTNADERQFGNVDIVPGAAFAFEDFVRDSRKAAGHAVRIKDNGHAHLFATSPGRVKERSGL
jgi:hypothetical protein